MPTTIPKAWASPEVVAQILLVGEREAPNEACGIVTPDLAVVQLPNSATSPTDSYAIASEDLGDAVWRYHVKSGADMNALSPAHFMVFHTHPGGVVGPGPGDMHNKVGAFQYIVISLPNGEAVQF